VRAHRILLRGGLPAHPHGHVRARSSVLVARVNCVAEMSICNAFGIRSYPTVYWGTDTDFIAAEASGRYAPLDVVGYINHDAASVSAFVNQRLVAAREPSGTLEPNISAFDAVLAARMQALLGPPGAAAAGGSELAGHPAGVGSARLNLWDAELAMVMAVQ
jgi:hypothetical protein